MVFPEFLILLIRFSTRLIFSAGGIFSDIVNYQSTFNPSFR
jgi:hypothetical protein